jgi:hypothetical protein
MEKAWDDELSSENTNRWQQWLDGLSRLEDFKVSRCVQPQDFGEIAEAKLHHFSDGSTAAYGAVSYLRLVNRDGHVHCTLLMAKSRLAPMSTMTVPRLELSAAVTAVKLDSLLRKEVNILDRQHHSLTVREK